MRPARHKRSITSQLEGLVNLRKQLELLLADISNVIQKGENWLLEQDEGLTFLEIHEHLCEEMESYSSKLCSIADEDDCTEMCQSAESESHEKRIITGNNLVGDSNDHNANILLKNLNDKILILENKYESLEKHKFQAIVNDTISEDSLVMDISSLDTILKEFQSNLDTFQSQNKKLSEKSKHFEEKCNVEIDEKLNKISVKLQNQLETVFKKQEEEYEKMRNLNFEKIRIEVHNATSEKLKSIIEEHEGQASLIDKISKNSSRIDTLLNELQSSIDFIQSSEQEKNCRKKFSIELKKNLEQLTVKFQNQLETVSKKQEENEKLNDSNFEKIRMEIQNIMSEKLQSLEQEQVSDLLNSTSYIEIIDSSEDISSDEYQRTQKDDTTLSENKKQVTKLEAQLENLRKKIETYRNHAMSLDSMELNDSAFIMEGRLTKRFVTTWHKVCGIIKKYEPKAASSSSMDDTARKEFRDIGERLIKRHEDFIATLENGENIIRSMGTDRNYINLESRRRLDCNKRKSVLNLDNVIAKYYKLHNNRQDIEDDGE